MPDRYRLNVNIGNLLELLGAAAAVYGLARLAGLAYGLILLGILLVVAAEFIYDSTVLRIPLPHRPHPITAVRGLPARIRKRVWTYRHGRQVAKIVRAARRSAELAPAPAPEEDTPLAWTEARGRLHSEAQ
jgi:hypothetical protein